MAYFQGSYDTLRIMTDYLTKVVYYKVDKV